MDDTGIPQWVQVIGKVLGILIASAGGAIGVYFMFRKKTLTATAEQQELADKRAEREAERSSKVKRDALAEAWATVDRQNDRLEEQEQEIRALREQIGRCEADRAALKIIAAWARRKGMPLTPEIDELLRTREPAKDGSGGAPALPTEPREKAP